VNKVSLALRRASTQVNLGIRREPGAALAYVALVLIIILWVLRTPRLTSVVVTMSIATQVPYVMVAIGMGIVLLSRGIDLSVGYMVALSNVIVVSFSVAHGFTWLGALLAILATSAVGLANGLLVGVLRLPALVVTVATGSIVWGISLYVLPLPTALASGAAKPSPSFMNFGMTLIGPLPLQAILIFVIPLVIWWPINRSRAGMALRAVGGDEAAAFVSGLAQWRSRAMAYMLSGLFAGLAGVFLTMTTSSGDPNAGTPYTLNAIAAAVLGGISLAGGRGSITGAIAGGLILGYLTNLLGTLNVNSALKYVVTGALLIIVIGVPYLITQLRARRAVTS